MFRMLMLTPPSSAMLSGFSARMLGPSSLMSEISLYASKASWIWVPGELLAGRTGQHVPQLRPQGPLVALGEGQLASSGQGTAG